MRGQVRKRLNGAVLAPAGLLASAAGALAVLGFAGPAIAARSTTPVCGKTPPLLPCNHLAVRGPIAAAKGVSFPLKARGYANQKVGAPSPADAVVGWDTAHACQSSYAQEVTTQGSVAPDLNTAVEHRFSVAFTVPASRVTLPAGATQATMYWCVYLINATTTDTFRKAFLTYKVLGQPSGPGGGPGSPP